MAAPEKWDGPEGRIWALVCGLPPGDARRRRPLLVCRACIDGSGSGDPHTLVLAGYIASVEQWAAFTKDWQDVLDMSPRLEYFTMNEIRRPERVERCSWFYRVIERHVTAAISCVIDVQGLGKAVSELTYSAGIRKSIHEKSLLHSV